MNSFLFELGTEELPDGFILPAVQHLEKSLKELLTEKGLKPEEIRCYSTPRRLAVLALGLEAKQEDIQIDKLGPSVAIAYDKDGNLSPAGLGFLKKQGASERDVRIEKTEKGEFLAISFVQKGKSSPQILREWILEVITQVALPKRMIWKDKDLGFLRPIRWIVALFNDEVIELDFHGIKSDRYSYGNRFLGLGERLIIENAEHYEEALGAKGVVADREKRKELIRQQSKDLVKAEGLIIKEDERLLETVTNLVESPTAVMAKFKESYLSLPEKVITSTITQNQKYFSIFDNKGKLQNKFIFVSNGNPEYSQIIREGNEKVVNARLDDALWFYDEDCKESLESYLPKLKDVVFQADLGTMAEKSERIIRLSEYICEKLGIEGKEREKALRTAELCKADLVTLMLGEKEFTKLQGYIGWQYALKSGEDEEVALGIYEHYMPRGSKDELPSTLCGQVCAVADKVDTVVGIIAAGLLPTGSADPFALRRAAGGALQIIGANSWKIDIFELIGVALKIVSEKLKPKEGTKEYLHKYFLQRVDWLLKEMGIAYDVSLAVMNSGVDTIPDIYAKALALQGLKSQDDFIRLVIAYKRVANIISQTKEFKPLSAELFEEAAEEELYLALKSLNQKLNRELKELNYQQALKELLALGQDIDRFFDAVLVNCENQALKDNRYALLKAIREEFNRVADLSLIVVENELTGV